MDAELKAELEKLRTENAKLKAKTGDKALTMKIGAKGGASLYGLGRFPVTLYKEQWLKLLDFAEKIREFLNEHDGALKSRD